MYIGTGLFYFAKSFQHKIRGSERYCTVRAIIYKSLVFLFGTRKNEKIEFWETSACTVIIYQKAYSLNITDGPFGQPEAL